MQIVEYLKDVSESTNFYAIFLTHNYDFHRTISSRLKIPRENCLFTIKNSDVLNLATDKYQNDPFKYWKRNLHIKEEFVISAIPFVRNLAEYCGHETEKLELTSLLHIKPDTKNITIEKLESIYKVILKDKHDLKLINGDKIVIDLLFEIAEKSLTESDEKAELESKIILSIAIRLLAEDFMIKKISNPSFVNKIKKNQTRELFERFKIEFYSENETIKILERVNLMTPENIHLNSFMFEPILDMSPEHLKNLYRDVKQINDDYDELHNTVDNAI
jgi:hypothetical protein